MPVLPHLESQARELQLHRPEDTFELSSPCMTEPTTSENQTTQGSNAVFSYAAMEFLLDLECAALFENTNITPASLRYLKSH